MDRVFAAQTSDSSSANRPSKYGWIAVAFLIFLPLEGILRKWLLNSIEQPLGFLRDPLVITTYILYFQDRNRKPKAWLSMFYLFSVPFAIYAILVGMAQSTPIIGTFLGIRYYILYVPFGFILAERLNRSDLRMILLVSYVLAIPIAALVVLQFKAPIASPINKGLTDDVAGRFVVAANVVRPYGPFTFAQALDTFAAMLVAFCFVGWERRADLRIPWVLLSAASVATGTMGALSGARTFFGGAALVLITYLVAGVTSPQASRGMRRLVTISLAVLGFFVVFTVVFPKAAQTMSERQANAERVEGSTIVRALRYFSDPIDTAQTAPLLGYGPGSGSNAVTRLTSQSGFIYGETDWVHMVNELGAPIGFLVIVIRCGLTIWLGLTALKQNREVGDGTAFILFGFSGYLILVAQTTSQNQILSFCWFGLALTLSSARLAQAPRKRVVARPSGTAPPRPSLASN